MEMKIDLAKCVTDKAMLNKKLMLLGDDLSNLATIILCEEDLGLTEKDIGITSEYWAELHQEKHGFDKEMILDMGHALKEYLERTDYYVELWFNTGCTPEEFLFGVSERANPKYAWLK